MAMALPHLSLRDESVVVLDPTSHDTLRNLLACAVRCSPSESFSRRTSEFALPHSRWCHISVAWHGDAHKSRIASNQEAFTRAAQWNRRSRRPRQEQRHGARSLPAKSATLVRARPFRRMLSGAATASLRLLRDSCCLRRRSALRELKFAREWLGISAVAPANVPRLEDASSSQNSDTIGRSAALTTLASLKAPGTAAGSGEVLQINALIGILLRSATVHPLLPTVRRRRKLVDIAYGAYRISSPIVWRCEQLGLIRRFSRVA